MLDTPETQTECEEEAVTPASPEEPCSAIPPEESAAAETSPEDTTASETPAAKETAGPNPGEAPAPADAWAAKKQRYCKRCGSPVDRKTKKCQGCGKQCFRVPKHLGTMILGVVCALLVGLNIFQYMKTDSLKGELEQATSTISAREKAISSQERTISAQKSQITGLKEDVTYYRELWYDSFEETKFMDDYVVIVGDNNNRYHKYGCEDLDLSYFYVYNIDNAKAQGYRACSKCN